eukprot:365898-Chlamydomonas_euryale.AAC.13
MQRVGAGSCRRRRPAGAACDCATAAQGAPQTRHECNPASRRVGPGGWGQPCAQSRRSGEDAQERVVRNIPAWEAGLHGLQHAHAAHAHRAQERANGHTSLDDKLGALLGTNSASEVTHAASRTMCTFLTCTRMPACIRLCC